MQNKPVRQALIFDFDGLILDTESVEVEVFKQEFAKLGLHFDLQAYLKIVGSSAEEGYNPWAFYAEATGGKYTTAEARRFFDHLTIQALDSTTPMEGVLELIDEAKASGLLLAVGSSSPASWVLPKLEKLGILSRFDTVVTRDDVSSAKPSPEIFLTVLERLKVLPQHALVLEDSKNGCLAALRAAIPVVHIPNEVTLLEENDLAAEKLSSLKELNLSKYFVL
ncbi:MAG: HAD-IA family hydrolase [Anaerolineaceae bacterium]|nr:HAD-IA family hydrolase [Anaerolineaceae bacterium]